MRPGASRWGLWVVPLGGASRNGWLIVIGLENRGEKPIPSGYVKKAIENGHRNSGFTH